MSYHFHLYKDIGRQCLKISTMWKKMVHKARACTKYFAIGVQISQMFCLRHLCTGKIETCILKWIQFFVCLERRFHPLTESFLQQKCKTLVTTCCRIYIFWAFLCQAETHIPCSLSCLFVSFSSSHIGWFQLILFIYISSRIQRSKLIFYDT